MTTHRMFRSILFVGVLSSVACRQDDGDKWAGKTLDDPVPRWTAAMDTLKVPGMAVAIVGPDGPLFLRGFGVRDLEATLPVTPDTRFYIASATKPFVALSTVMLADQGVLDLNRPVRTYLPQFRLAEFTESITITLRDLLAHRRGLQDYAITFGEAFTGQMTEERFYRLLRNVQAVGELDYSNLHYTILGRVIDTVSGGTWKEHLQERVFTPAGMHRTTTSAAPLTVDSNAARPYELVDGRLRRVAVKTDRTMHAAGGMVSTVNDLARWVELHLNKGRLDGKEIVPAHVVAEMQAPQIYEDDPSPFTPEHKRIGWGLGWELREDRGDRMVYHGGAYNGWITHVSFMPGLRRGVVVLTNSGDGSARLLADLVALDAYDRMRGLESRQLLPVFARIVRSAEQRSSAGAATARSMPDRGPRSPLENYVSTYVNADWGTLEVWKEGSDLKARIGDLALPLVWNGPDAFIADNNHSGMVMRDRAGRVASISLSDLRDEGLVEFVRR